MPSRFRLLCAAMVLLLAACASGPTHNPTVFPFEIEREALAAKPLKTVVIAHVNLGAPSRNYLDEVTPVIDGRVASYMEKNGYNVLPQRTFRQHWNTAVRAFGDPVDPTTGRVNMKTFSQLMQSVRDRMQEETDLDAFVFTDLIELETPFNGGLKHLARWDGVSRRPSLQGPGSGVSGDFDWNLPASVVSLQVTVFDMELKRLFVSRGGIDATDAIDTRSSSGRYVRRRNILENSSYIQEGIRLAFHPLIEMQDWPGNP
ncbi:hypothetical protein [Chromatocurvus halotolerans]|nr:hypothetical protein [Chromatocurvus halotolerans]